MCVGCGGVIVYQSRVMRDGVGTEVSATHTATAQGVTGSTAVAHQEPPCSSLNATVRFGKWMHTHLFYSV